MNTGKIGQLGSTGPGMYMHTWQPYTLGLLAPLGLYKTIYAKYIMLAHIMYNPTERQAIGSAHYIFFFTH